MARPKKNTVDYFPHSCNHSKTMFIIEQKYGNDGYAFWFKLLEIIGNTDNHYIDCNNGAVWEFLQAKTHLDENRCNEILDLLAILDAIDSDLWEQRIIWSENFITNINDVYKNRRIETPSKPSFYKQKPESGAVSTEENRQSKVKESKVKESKVGSTSEPDFIQKILDLFISEFSNARGDEFIITDKGKERSSIGKLLGHYRKQNPEKTSEETLSDFQALFKQSLGIDDRWLQDNISPSIVLNKLNFIKSKLKKNGNTTTNNKSNGATADDIIKAVDKAFKITSVIQEH